MQIREWFEGYQQLVDIIFTCCGLPPMNQAQVEQTATEIKSKSSTTSETIKLLKQLRVDQYTRVLEKVLIIGKLWDGKGERPFTASLPESDRDDKMQEVEEAKIRIEAYLSNHVTEIAKIYNVNKQEAESILKDNIEIYSKVFEKTKSMKPAEEESTDDKQRTD